MRCGVLFFFFSSRRRHTRCYRDWSSDVCSSDLVGAQMYDMLVERDQSLKLVPSLAAELPKLVNPTTWEIKLRKGVKFHNGEDFTADSVKFSLERLINPANKLRGASSFAPIDRVEIVDP